MRYSKWLVCLALAGGMALPGASTLSAQDRWRDRQDLRYDYGNVNRLRADIARDQWRLNEAIRCGRNWEADRISRDIARDQRALDFQYRDIHRDRRDLRRDYWR